MANGRLISDYTDQELENFKKAYLKAKKIEGGKFSLTEIELEMARRLPNPFGVRQLAAKIKELGSISNDGLVTYGQIWKEFRPGIPWKANYSRRVVGQALGTVIYYCIKKQIPILSTLVVAGGKRELTDQAVQNIYDECKKYGVDVGLNPRAFVVKEQKRAREFPIERLPSA